MLVSNISARYNKFFSTSKIKTNNNCNYKHHSNIYALQKNICFGSKKYNRMEEKRKSFNYITDGYIGRYEDMRQLLGNYTPEHLRIINTAIDNLAESDFENLISELSKYGSCGSTKASIGINYSNGNIKDASIVFQNEDNYTTEYVDVSFDEFVNIVTILKNLSVSKNLSKEEKYNRLYSEYIEHLN